MERLTRHLNKGIPKDAQKSYLTFVRTMVPKNPIIHIDDSDMIKPEGRKFEALGLVRDGSKSTDTKTVYAGSQRLRTRITAMCLIHFIWVRHF